MTNRPVIALAALFGLLLTQIASAHPGHDHSGFSAGVLHPLTGVDHLVAMFSVGLWAFQLGKKAIWQVPAAFVSLMLVGAGLARAGVAIPFAEQGIAASVLVMGLLIVSGFKMSARSGMLLVGTFAIFHGWAHGHEIRGASAVTFGVGFAISTALLHAAGIGFAILVSSPKKQNVSRVVACAMVILGFLLMAGIV